MTDYTIDDFVAYKRERIASWLSKAKFARSIGDRRRFFYCMGIMQTIHGTIAAVRNAFDGDEVNTFDEDDVYDVMHRE